MSYDEYIKDLDYEDLKNLVERCKFKMSEIEMSGKIPLYLVSCSCLNHFASTDEAKATTWLKELMTLLIEADKLEEVTELRLHKRMVWESELKNWREFNTKPEQCVLYKY